MGKKDKDIEKPAVGEYPVYSSMYIDLISEGEVLHQLKRQVSSTEKLITGLNKKQLEFRYAPGKWTIKEILIHMIDDERIYAYRALRIGRGDTTPLPSFEQDDYVPYYQAEKRSVKSILKEYKAVRKSTIQLFQNFSEEDVKRMGTANNYQVSVRALAYHIAGHELHHLHLIKNKYLSQT